MNTVKLLNRDGTFLTKITLARAIRYIAKNKVMVDEYSDEYMNGVNTKILKPSTVRLVKQLDVKEKK